MQVIDQINGSALFAQSAYSASIATNDSLGRDLTATYLTGISIPESATWNDTSDVVQSNSAQWSQGGNIPVSNSGDLYKVEFDGVDLYGYKSTTNIPNYAYSAVSSSDAFMLYNTSPDPTFDDEPFYEDISNWSAFDIISISSNGGEILPASSHGEYDVTALDVYYKAASLWDYNSDILDEFSGYIGKITYDNLSISSYFDKPSYYDNIIRGELTLWFSSNLDYFTYLDNECICSVGNKVQSGTDTFEGIFVPTSAQLLPYPMTFVSTSSEATGANILYVVTGTGV